MTPEARVKNKVKAVLEELHTQSPVYRAMPMGTRFGYNGDPDFLVCWQGRMFGIETKADRQLPTALQTQRLLEIEAAGGVPLVIDKNNVELLADEMRARVIAGEYHERQEYFAAAVANLHAREKAAGAADEGDGVAVRK